MADERLREIVENLRALEASDVGRRALNAPYRGDYNWGDDEPGTVTPETVDARP